MQRVLGGGIKFERYGRMPRLARLDAPGVSHHVMGRGIERREIFLSDEDREDFITRRRHCVARGPGCVCPGFA